MSVRRGLVVVTACGALALASCGESQGVRVSQGGGSGGGGGGGADGAPPTQERVAEFERTYEQELGADQPNLLESDDPTPVVVPWAEVLDPQVSDQITRVEPDRVVFPAGTNLSDLEPMEIISSYDEDHFFLRRVVSISEQGGELVVRTVDARVDEAIIKGNVNLSTLPTGATPPPEGMRQQGLNVSRVPLDPAASPTKFKADLMMDGTLALEGEFPLNSDYALKPSGSVRITQGMETDFGFEANIAFGGNSAALCEEFGNSATDEDRDTAWIGQNIQTWPAEQRQLAWAIKWSGNSMRGDDHGREWWSHSGRIGQRGAFREAVEGFRAYAAENGFEDSLHFEGTVVREAEVPPDHRQQVLRRYEALHAELAAEPAEDLRFLIEILRATDASDDLSWINTAPMVARQHCAGVTTGVKAHADTSIGLETQFGLKVEEGRALASVDDLEEGWVDNRGTFEHSITKWTGGIKIFWIGWFPIVVHPEFDLIAYMNPPKVTGSFGIQTGKDQYTVSAGFNADYTNGNDDFDAYFQVDHEDGDEWRAFNEAEASVSVGAEVGVKPTFRAVFYGAAAMGAATPVYAKAEGRIASSVNREGRVRSSICVGNEAGVKLDVVGELRNPFGSNGNASQTLVDTCNTQVEFLQGFCSKASVGLSLTSDAQGNFFGDPIFTRGSSKCPSEGLEVQIEWDQETDVDLYVVDPNGMRINYASNPDLLDSCRPSRNECGAGDDPFREKVTWGMDRDIPLGEYRVWAVNESGDEAARVELKVTYTGRDGNAETLAERTFSLPGEDDRSEEVTFTLDE